MTGCLSQFVDNSTFPTAETQIPWIKSIDNVSKYLCLFRTIDQFDDSTYQLEHVLNALNEMNAVNKCDWLTNKKRSFKMNNKNIRLLILIYAVINK